MKSINVAILIVVSDYEQIQKLPGCKNDFDLMSDLIDMTEKYDEIYRFNDNTTSIYIKENVSSIFESLKDKNIGELFFYFSGHGHYDGINLRYILSDFTQDKINMTTLTNEYIDQQIRSVNPKLSVKVVDACNSGVPYIKSISEDFGNVFEVEKAINSCYFMFSSHSNQSSYVDKISHFTKAFAESIISYEGEDIKYISIIDYIKDEFSSSDRQTPYFINQGSLTEDFCKITDLIKNIDITKYFKPITSVPKVSSDLLDLVKGKSKLYIKKEEIEDILVDIKSLIQDSISLPNFEEMFELEVREVKNYTDIRGIKNIASWVDKNPNDYFVKVEKKEVTFDDSLGSFSRIINQLNPKREPVNISTDLEIIFDTLKMKAIPKFASILPYQCNVVFLLSRYDLTVFYKFYAFKETGWEVYNYSTSSKWHDFSFNYIDYETSKTLISGISIDFCEFIENDIRSDFEIAKSE